MLRRRELPRRDSEENLSFWTTSTKRKFNELIHVKNTGKLPESAYRHDQLSLSFTAAASPRVNSLRPSPNQYSHFAAPHLNSAVKKVMPAATYHNGFRMSMENNVTSPLVQEDSANPEN